MRPISFLALLALACGPRGGGSTMTPDGPGYPTVMRAPAELGGDFLMEQEVTMTHPQGEHSFRAVLQKQGDEMLLLGLAGHGGRAFMLKQTPEGVEFERFIPIEFPFPPEYIFHDVHRTWFSDAAIGTVELHGERVVTEGDANGAVTRRTFERLDGAPEGIIDVRYEGTLSPGAPVSAAPPPSVVLENGWFGYRATVRTLRWQPL